MRWVSQGLNPFYVLSLFSHFSHDAGRHSRGTMDELNL